MDRRWGKKTPEHGAAAIVFAATSPSLADIGGVYVNNSDISQLNDHQPPVSAEEISGDVVSHAIDPRSAQRLWDLSEQLIKA